MRSFSEDYQLWNTPLVSSYLMWRFARGFQSYEGRIYDAPSIILCLIGNAIATHPRMLKRMTPRINSLSMFAESFVSNNQSEALLDLQLRVKEHLQEYMYALDAGIAAKLLRLDTSTATVSALGSDETDEPAAIKALAKNLRSRQGSQAERLGKWFAECGSINRIVSILGVNL